MTTARWYAPRPTDDSAQTSSRPQAPLDESARTAREDGARADATSNVSEVRDLGEAAPRSTEPWGTVSGGSDECVDRQSALRALRNLEATEARLERNSRREIDEARGKLVQELLPVLDNLDRTIGAAQRGHGDPAMLEGVRLVRQQLEGVLRGYGVERIDARDQRFDPGVHDAIGVTPVADPRLHGMVIEQLDPGYRFGERLLRPARVTVGKLVAQQARTASPLWR
jgi:molecular chaperone GrpE (heat shock protein)